VKFWLAHKPKDMGELYSALKVGLPTRLAEAERVGYGFVLRGKLFQMFQEKGCLSLLEKLRQLVY
jgi:hypothetical protein